MFKYLETREHTFNKPQVKQGITRATRKGTEKQDDFSGKHESKQCCHFSQD